MIKMDLTLILEAVAGAIAIIASVIGKKYMTVSAKLKDISNVLSEVKDVVVAVPLVVKEIEDVVDAIPQDLSTLDRAQLEAVVKEVQDVVPALEKVAKEAMEVKVAIEALIP